MVFGGNHAIWFRVRRGGTPFAAAAAWMSFWKSSQSCLMGGQQRKRWSRRIPVTACSLLYRWLQVAEDGGALAGMLLTGPWTGASSEEEEERPGRCLKFPRISRRMKYLRQARISSWGRAAQWGQSSESSALVACCLPIHLQQRMWASDASNHTSQVAQWRVSGGPEKDHCLATSSSVFIVGRK